MTKSAAVFSMTVAILVSAIVLEAQQTPRSSKSGGGVAISIEKTNKRPQSVSTALTIENLEKQLRSDPSDAVILNNLGVMYFLKGRIYEAQSLIRKAAQGAPNASAIRVNLAVTYKNLFNPSLAIETLKDVSRKDPSNPRSLRLLCEVYVSEELVKEARKCFESLERSGGLDPLSAAYFGELLLESKDTKRALVMLERADTKFPDDARVKNTLGMALFYRKNYSRAEVFLARAVELSPGANVLRYNLALAQMMTRKRGAALEQYRYLKTADPELAGRLFKEMFRDKLVTVRAK